MESIKKNEKGIQTLHACMIIRQKMNIHKHKSQENIGVSNYQDGSFGDYGSYCKRSIHANFIYTKRKQVSEILNKKSQINSKQETPNKSQMYKFQSANLLVSDRILDLGFIWSFLFRIYLGFLVSDFVVGLVYIPVCNSLLNLELNIHHYYNNVCVIRKYDMVSNQNVRFEIKHDMVSNQNVRFEIKHDRVSNQNVRFEYKQVPFYRFQVNPFWECDTTRSNDEVYIPNQDNISFGCMTNFQYHPYFNLSIKDETDEQSLLPYSKELYKIIRFAGFLTYRFILRLKKDIGTQSVQNNLQTFKEN